MRKKRSTLWIAGILSLLLIGLFAFKKPGDRYFEIAKNLDIFATLYKEVNTYYVDDINPNELMRIGIESMLASLDPYTNYIPEDEIEDFRTMTTGEYGGIGAIIGKRNNRNTILMPYEGFPAHKNGLKIGDVVLKINGIDVNNKSTSEISQLLKGQANTTVEVTIKRYGEDEPKNITLKREKISIDNVPYFGMVSEEIGYLKLSDFTTGAGKEVRKAVESLKSDGAKKLILDLRGNPGGLLSEAVNVSNAFIQKGAEVVSTKGKMEEWNKTYRALDQPEDVDIPIAVLVNNRSASAAEIVAGVIQDYDRGILVGQRTFGKGLVQATRPLTYNSQLKVTTAKYYTPSGRCIQAIDYSHRGDDGNFMRLPDSLKVAFKTDNGRIVFDGGGIDPDLEVLSESYAPITISLVSKGLLFDYATVYHYNHPTIAPAKQFHLSDADYAAFVDWLEDKSYDYETKVEKTLDDLIEHAKNEKYYEDISAQIQSLKTKISHNKKKDLQTFRNEIELMLEEQIVSRYYLQNGILEASFKEDQEVQTAIAVLNDSARYTKILSGTSQE